MPTTVLTDIAVNLITTAAGTGSSVAIADVALGDGLGGNYTPGAGATGLKRELARQPIESRIRTGATTWRIKAEFGPETPAFAVREMGFFDTAGNLIALYAGLDMPEKETGAVSYLIAHFLNFSRVSEGLVIIDAPDDVMFDFMAVTIRNQALQGLDLFRQGEALRAAGIL